MTCEGVYNSYLFCNFLQNMEHDLNVYHFLRRILSHRLYVYMSIHIHNTSKNFLNQFPSRDWILYSIPGTKYRKIYHQILEVCSITYSFSSLLQFEVLQFHKGKWMKQVDRRKENLVSSNRLLWNIVRNWSLPGRRNLVGFCFAHPPSFRFSEVSAYSKVANLNERFHSAWVSQTSGTAFCP